MYNLKVRMPKAHKQGSKPSINHYSSNVNESSNDTKLKDDYFHLMSLYATNTYFLSPLSQTSCLKDGELGHTTSVTERIHSCQMLLTGSNDHTCDIIKPILLNYYLSELIISCFKDKKINLLNSL